MSDKTIGVLGQKYENRKTGKEGVLVSQNDEAKKLSFLGEDAEPFEVSYAAFKSNWRAVKVANEEFSDEENREIPEETKCNCQPSEGDPIAMFTKELCGARDAFVEVTNGVLKIKVEGIDVVEAKPINNAYSVMVLPDVFTYTDWHSSFKLSDVHFNVHTGSYKHGYVVVNNVTMTMPQLLDSIKKAVIGINLYGYKES